MIPTSEQAYQLMHDSGAVLARMEQNGIHVDTDYCKRAIRHLDRRVARMQTKILDSDLGRIGRETFGFKLNINSDKQLSHILYNVMGLSTTFKTNTGKDSVKAEALLELDVLGLDILIRSKQLVKARDTYLKNFLEEAVDGYVHPFFHLHLVRTFRSSSSNPNIQNIPNRDPEISEICRKAIIARPGRKIAALDFSGIEVKIGTAYHKDPTMMKYNSDLTTDLHRDMAQEIYCFTTDDWEDVRQSDPKVAKAIRHSSKNQFVFPSFYGDWYKSCAPNLWKSAHKKTHILPDGTGLDQWLYAMGIENYNHFETHMEEIERAFWDDRFTVYSEWKEVWWNNYQEKGYFDTLTGFRCQGVMGRNDAINYPVQGSAFHCTLFTLIEVQKIIDKHDLSTLLIGQIHDEIILDLVPREQDFLLKQCKEIMTKKIREKWKWINVPIDIETEITPIDGAWSEKQELK